MTGLVRRDDLGLIVDADPASIVDLPGDGAAAPTSSAGIDGLLPNTASQSPGPSQAAAAASRRAVAAAALPDVLTTISILLALLAVSAAALALSRNRGRIGKIAVLRAPAVSARLARIRSWRPGRGRRNRP
ncbi:MAG: hypothetical protein ACHQ01_04760 [Candidatus Limnocylindrales bacterium]